MTITATQRSHAQDLLDFIDASPSPWHAVATSEHRLLAAGFTRLEDTARWQLQAGGRDFVVRGGSSLIAFVIGNSRWPKPDSASSAPIPIRRACA